MVLSLALGIGLNTAIFSFIDALFLRPLPGVEKPDRIVVIYSQADGGPAYMPISYLNYKDFRNESRSFESLAASQGIAVGLAGEDGAENIAGEMVTANYFETLGIRMEIGRKFLPEEDLVPGKSPVVILSHRIWRERFAEDPGILHRRITLNGQLFTVVGVTAESFRGTGAYGSPSLWVPTMMYQTVFMVPDLFEQRAGQTLQVYGRLGPGLTLSAAQAEMRTLASRLEKAYPDDNRGKSVSLVPLMQATIHPSRRSVFIRAGFLLMAVVAILLLITCVNVANLLLVRALERGRELALRLSLGAGRRHLVGQLLTESLLLAIAGGLLGLLVAVWAWKLLWQFRPSFFSANAITFSLDGRMLGFALLTGLLTGVLFGLAPVSWVSRANLSMELRETRPLVTFGGHRISAGDFFIVLQVAFCAIALAGAGLFLKSLWNARQIDPGFATRNLLMASFDVQSLGYDDAQGQDFQGRLLARASALPGVEAAALGENRLLGGFRLWRRVLPEGGEIVLEEAPMVGSSRVGAGYFETTGIPLVTGRGFDARDRQGAPAVAVINESLRRKLWPDRTPLGARVRLDDEEELVEIVGVVKDANYIRLGEEVQPFLYLPMAQRYSSRATLHLRTRGDAAALAATVRREVAALDRNLPLSEVRTISEVLDQSLWAPRTSAMLLSLLALLALVLAAVGVYGVTTFAVARRRFEIGVRMALGARRGSVVRLVFGKGIMVLGVGLTLGLIGAFILNRWISGLLYGAEVGDPATFFGVLALLLGMGTLAIILPAVRAARIEPVTALRGT